MKKDYDFLLGMDWVNKNVKTIDINDRTITLNNEVKLPFLNKVVEEEINVLEACKIDNMSLEHLNAKEKIIIERMIRRYEKLLFQEGDQLTNTNTVVHEIRTSTSDQINSKLYRYTHNMKTR